MQHIAQETAVSDVSAIEGREDDVRPDAMVLLERAPPYPVRWSLQSVQRLGEVCSPVVMFQQRPTVEKS
jgi:hypothetical protein